MINCVYKILICIFKILLVEVINLDESMKKEVEKVINDVKKLDKEELSMVQGYMIGVIQTKQKNYPKCSQVK